MRGAARALPFLAAAMLLGAGCGAAPVDTSNVAGYPTQDVVSPVVADPALHAELPAAIRAAGTLSLGTTRYPGTAQLPHSGESTSGVDIGLDVDLRNAVARVLGVRWTVQDGTFATVIPGVQNGRFDVGQDNFGVTRAREQVVDFATYLTDGQAFLGSRDVSLPAAHTLTDLCGLVIGTSPGSTFQQILTDGAARCDRLGRPRYTVQYFADTAPIFLGLVNGRTDVYFGPTLGVEYAARHVPDTRFLGQITSTPVGFVTGRGSPLAPALRDAVNELITTGAYRRILAKWGLAGSGITRSQVNPPSGL